MATEPVTQTPAPHAAGAKIEKFKKDIRKDLQKLKNIAEKYNVPEIKPDYLLAYLENNVVEYVHRTSEPPLSVKEELERAAYMLDKQITKARQYAEALSAAYENNDVKATITNFTNLYATLKAMKALLRIIKKYVAIGKALDLFSKVMGAAENMKYVITEYLANNIKLNDELIAKLNENLTYYDEWGQDMRIFYENFEAIKFDIENDTELRRGTYEVLKEALYTAMSYLKDGIAFASEANEILEDIRWFEFKFGDIIFNVIEAYADFTALQAVYEFLKYHLFISEEGFEIRLEKAINNASNALNILLNYFS